MLEAIRPDRYIESMERTVNVDIINEWIDEKNPNGVAKLALELGVSISTVNSARLGIAPKRRSTRKKFWEFL